MAEGISFSFFTNETQKQILISITINTILIMCWEDVVIKTSKNASKLGLNSLNNSLSNRFELALKFMNKDHVSFNSSSLSPFSARLGVFMI